MSAERLPEPRDPDECEDAKKTHKVNGTTHDEVELKSGFETTYNQVIPLKSQYPDQLSGQDLTGEKETDNLGAQWDTAVMILGASQPFQEPLKLLRSGTSIEDMARMGPDWLEEFTPFLRFFEDISSHAQNPTTEPPSAESPAHDTTEYPLAEYEQTIDATCINVLKGVSALPARAREPPTWTMGRVALEACSTNANYTAETDGGLWNRDVKIPNAPTLLARPENAFLPEVEEAQEFFRALRADNSQQSQQGPDPQQEQEENDGPGDVMMPDVGSTQPQA